jgi:hypothetical protein
MSGLLENVPKALLDDIIENRCLPIVGAGFSRNATIPGDNTMPLWEDLGRLFADELGPSYPYSNPTDVISAYEHAYGRPKLIERLRGHLHVLEARPGQVHRAFCETPFDIVCTTNFDRLLETAYQASNRYCHAIMKDNQLSTVSGSPNQSGLGHATTLLKVHGDEQHPESVVITEKDYDSYLVEHPLLSTFLSNLLITKTALFVGYSVDDPDFRQIWQVVKNRLGNLSRRAYAIEVSCSDYRRQRFERRGINVVDLSAKSYSAALEELFRQLAEYWISARPFRFPGLDDETRAQFELPLDASSTLCFIDTPVELMSFYRSNVIPLIREQGLHPLTVHDVVAPGDNINAAIASIVSRAELLILDLPSIDYVPRLRVNVDQLYGEKHMLVIAPRPISGQMHFQFLQMKNVSILEREDDIFERTEDLVASIRKWTETVMQTTGIGDKSEPHRLLEKREYSAAVVSAISLLEVTLSSRLSTRFPEKRPISRVLTALLSFGVSAEIIHPEDVDIIRDWYAVRNRVVHNRERVNARRARSIVRGILNLIDRISG